jgi:hypothetical protein
MWADVMTSGYGEEVVVTDLPSERHGYGPRLANHPLRAIACFHPQRPALLLRLRVSTLFP